MQLTLNQDNRKDKTRNDLKAILEKSRQKDSIQSHTLESTEPQKENLGDILKKIPIIRLGMKAGISAEMKVSDSLHADAEAMAEAKFEFKNGEIKTLTAQASVSNTTSADFYGLGSYVGEARVHFDFDHHRNQRINFARRFDQNLIVETEEITVLQKRTEKDSVHQELYEEGISIVQLPLVSNMKTILECEADIKVNVKEMVRAGIYLQENKEQLAKDLKENTGKALKEYIEQCNGLE